jgi:carboxylesterase
MPGADPKRAPFLFCHPAKTKTALLLIHGLTASPWEVIEVGKRAYEKGFNVYGIRLSGHGTTLEDLDRQSYQDWIRAGSEGFDLISHFADHIVIAGLSLGGLIALRLAENQKGSAVISLAAPLYLKPFLKIYISIVKNFKRFHYRPLSRGLEDYYYPAHSFHALQEMIALAKEVEEHLDRIIKPILVMQTEYDIRVDPRSGQAIIQKVKSETKELVTFEKKERVPHVMTTWENPLLEKILEKMTRFLLLSSSQ